MWHPWYCGRNTLPTDATPEVVCSALVAVHWGGARCPLRRPSSSSRAGGPHRRIRVHGLGVERHGCDVNGNLLISSVACSAIGQAEVPYQAWGITSRGLRRLFEELRPYSKPQEDETGVQCVDSGWHPRRCCSPVQPFADF